MPEVTEPTFPGRIFDGEGDPLDGRAPSLDQGRINACRGREAVQRGEAGDAILPVAEVWLMDEGARFAAIPAAVLGASVSKIVDGRSVVVLSRRPKTAAGIRTGLLDALDLALAPDAITGRA